ncbi:3-phenylpropionate/trans-cinnamate dioxygenase ferredoxin subunit [Solimonas aquatica]|uniref:3-phenylpropionate/trans-cinnamate dioxygenase ferredoxin subunit n=1 Tax=Solimonas aquatica TaxID=489703 RepID=A0A1H9G1M2_9GAMM|nr:non-heme iron oxygenase ferredoxin subunit [Solimonas aquatica]SEQ43608.1 3-phenylpropionate/trans-cinnamate dioxygenase ferredoxin subunit [Solimonas aquatica]
MSSSYARVVKSTEIPSGGRKVVEVEGKAIVICHVNNNFYAIANRCSHAERPLERGRLGQGWIACPFHGARFELATGKAMNLPATEPVVTYPLRIVEDWIEVLVEAAPPSGG